MNHRFRSVCSKQAGTAVAVSGFAANAGHTLSSRTTPGAGKSFALRTLSACVMLCFGAHGYAAPAGGVVAAGSATIAGDASRTTITQSSANAVINWQSFGIAAAEAVQFIQPGANAVALNRVLGSNPSSIFGSLSANGKVFLINPNGILFGSGSAVNVGGLVASTLDMSDANFMAGQYRFTSPGTGTIVNQGTIHADAGYVALLGTHVSNQGVISARLGSVVLAAGNAMTLDVAGDSLLNVKVDEGAVNALVQNGGLIRADGGSVLLTAQSAGNLLSTAVNNTGVIQAQTLQNRNGSIRLLGGAEAGTVSVGGTLDVSGAQPGQTGGSVTVTGHHVGLFGGRVDASGDAGGGSVLIGGGYQGTNPAVANASATYMSADSTIHADALAHGDGGTVVLWADGSTRANGSISARGGAQGGDGGLVETSGHWLNVSGIRVNASSPNGKRGMWLLDPADITISAAVTTGATLTANVFSPDSGVSSAVVNTTDLRNALQAGGGTDVTLTTTNTGAAGNGAGDITIASPLTWVVGSSATLTLNAAGDVNINADVSMSNGNLVVCCGRDVNVRAAITAAGGGGSVLLTAGRDIRVERTIANPATDITVTNGNIEMCAGRDVILSNTFNGAPLITMNDSGTGALGLGLSPGLVLSAGNAGTGPGPAGGTVLFTAGTRIALTRAAAPVLDATVNYNPLSYAVADRTDFSPLFTLAGAITLNERMLVFPDGATRTFNGTTTATFTGLKGAPAGVTLAGAGVANFDTAAEGLAKTITFTGFSLAGANANDFTFAASCCGPVPGVGLTTANITPAPPPVPVVPVPVPVVIVPPPVVLLPELDVGAAPAGQAEGQFVTPQFAPFIVAPMLLRPPETLLVVSPVVPPPMTLVVVQAETPPAPAPAPAPQAAPAPARPAPATVATPPAPRPATPAPLPAAPVRPPKPFRN